MVLKILKRKLITAIKGVVVVSVLWGVLAMFGKSSTLYNDDNNAVIEHIQFTNKRAGPLQPPDEDNILNDNQLMMQNETFLSKKDGHLRNKEAPNINDDPEKNKIDEENDKQLQINPPLKDIPRIQPSIKAGLGENGEAVNISKESLSGDDLQEYKTGWRNHAFNEYISKRISLHRTLPDPRDEKCKLVQYSTDLPDVSVIVTFHNEAWSVLLRSIHSIIDRTPEKVLKEIILADDCSTMPHLLEPLEIYLKNYPKVKIERAPEREGLIRARLRGYRAATGTVLIFLDSHIECAEGWIEPMIDRIAQNWTTVVTPVIDVINDDTFKFQYVDAQSTNVGGFDWNLIFTWHPIPETERKRRNYQHHVPVRSPTMAGGLFAINRKYFEYLGTYDDGMDIWGGENLEISFRIWMCGGTLETTPCSHVGHIFRKRSPYKWRGSVNVLLKNSVRLAAVWLDEYKYYYYQRIGNNLGDYGDISSRIELRNKLKCKSFEWFLKNVFPEQWVPGESLAHGQIKAKSGSFCLAGAADFGQTGKPLKIINCENGGNIWYLTLRNEIKRDSGCFDFYQDKGEIIVDSCHLMGGNQFWKFKEDNTLYHTGSNKCLEISRDGTKIFMNTCLGTDFQIWEWNRGPPDGPVRHWNNTD